MLLKERRQGLSEKVPESTWVGPTTAAAPISDAIKIRMAKTPHADKRRAERAASADQLVSEEFPLSEGALMLAKADRNVKTMGRPEGNIGIAEL